MDNIEKTYKFKHGELVFIINELGKLPYAQVCKVINFIDNVASKQEDDDGCCSGDDCEDENN
jgi:hypothetical protein